MLSKNLNDKNDLEERIHSDLRSRAGASSDTIEFGTDELEQTSKKTGRFGWVWFLLVVLAIISLIVIAMI